MSDLHHVPVDDILPPSLAFALGQDAEARHRIDLLLAGVASTPAALPTTEAWATWWDGLPTRRYHSALEHIDRYPPAWYP